MQRNENMIAALKRERAAYVAHGEEDRVRQVDEQLLHYGYVPAGQDPVTDETSGPKGRTAQADQHTAVGATAESAGSGTTSLTAEPAAAAVDDKKAPAVAKKTAASKRAQATSSGE